MRRLSRLSLVLALLFALLMPILAVAQTPTVAGDRLAWDQQMSAGEVASTTFAVFIDNVRFDVSAVCTPQPPNNYTCEAAYPSLAVGPHVIEVIAIRNLGGGSFIESARSAPFNIVVVPPLTSPFNLRNKR